MDVQLEPLSQHFPLDFDVNNTQSSQTIDLRQVKTAETVIILQALHSDTAAHKPQISTNIN